MRKDQVRQSKHSLIPTAAPNGKRPLRGPQGPDGSAAAALLETAIRLFCRNGITATGIDAIVSQSGVSRATLYNHFGSKEDLVAAALEHEGETWRTWFFARLASVDGSPRDRVLAIFDALAEWFSRSDYFGCALMNAVAEYRNGNPTVLAVTASHKRQVLDYIQGLCVGIGAQDARALASQLDLLMDGAIVKALVSRQPGPAREARAIAEKLCPATATFRTAH